MKRKRASFNASAYSSSSTLSSYIASRARIIISEEASESIKRYAFSVDVRSGLTYEYNSSAIGSSASQRSL